MNTDNAFGSLPGCVIVGAQKSGTTSMFHYMRQHPSLIPARVKEVHYFDGGLDINTDNYSKGEYWYRSFFPSVKSGQASFEASPLYLFHPLVPPRLKRLLPDVKIIMLLRNPADRAISHYCHSVRQGVETLRIEDAIDREEDRLRPVLEKKDYKSSIFHFFSYKSRGHYCDQIDRYLQEFSRDQIHVVQSEELFQDPHPVLRRAWGFLDIDDTVTINDTRVCNKGNGPTDIDRLARVHDLLSDYFEPYNLQLYDRIGSSFDW